MRFEARGGPTKFMGWVLGSFLDNPWPGSTIYILKMMQNKNLPRHPPYGPYALSLTSAQVHIRPATLLCEWVGWGRWGQGLGPSRQEVTFAHQLGWGAPTGTRPPDDCEGMDLDCHFLKLER
jgi:hypothetical protein